MANDPSDKLGPMQVLVPTFPSPWMIKNVVLLASKTYPDDKAKVNELIGFFIMAWDLAVTSHLDREGR